MDESRSFTPAVESAGFSRQLEDMIPAALSVTIWFTLSKYTFTFPILSSSLGAF